MPYLRPNGDTNGCIVGRDGIANVVTVVRELHAGADGETGQLVTGRDNPTGETLTTLSSKKGPVVPRLPAIARGFHPDDVVMRGIRAVKPNAGYWVKTPVCVKVLKVTHVLVNIWRVTVLLV